VHENWRYTLQNRRVRIRCKSGEQTRELWMDPGTPCDKIEERLVEAMGAPKRRRQLRAWSEKDE
jgi:hypothetical protein